jgi:hypothetical protein
MFDDERGKKADKYRCCRIDQRSFFALAYKYDQTGFKNIKEEPGL